MTQPKDSVGTTLPFLESLDEPFHRLVDGVRDYAIFLLDSQGRVASWNQGAHLLKGYTPAEIIGKHFSIFYPEEAVVAGWPQHELTEATRHGRFEDEGWRVRKDGSRFWASVTITAIRDQAGGVVAFSKITRDLTERRMNEERLHQSEERFRLLLEGVQDYAIMLLDPEGRVSSWNTGAQRLLGYRADEVIGQSFERFFSADERAQGLPAQELRRATLQRRSAQEGWRHRKDGSRFWADVVVTSMHDSEGNLLGFSKVTRDLSERKHLENLEEQGRHLTEFLAMLAHELRNPLAPIRNALGIMSMDKNLAPRVAWAREVIERQATHLSRLVDDLLDVSRITRGKLRLKTTSMDLRTAVHRALESSRPLIDSRGHKLEVFLPETPITVYGDVTRLTQVFLNLLNNAAKYTPGGGSISITASRRGEFGRVEVRDTGVGIPSQMLDHVFDLFAQGERTIDRSEGGLGIGLTLARRIVALHGGSIVAHSEGPGKGSCFEVNLPLLLVQTQGMEAPVEDFQPQATKRKRRIMVVDDNEDSAASVAMLLRMVGHEVDVHVDGARAVEAAREHLPEIILLDIGLPGMSGYEVSRQLRELPGGDEICLFAMTGFGQDEDRRRSLEAGFNGHLVKPVLPAELIRLVEGNVPAAERPAAPVPPPATDPQAH